MLQFNQRKQNCLSSVNEMANETVQNTNCRQKNRRIRCCGRVFDANKLNSETVQGQGQGRGNGQRMANDQGQGRGNGQRMANGQGQARGNGQRMANGQGRSQQV